jgi:nucleoside-diphosphate-sugar epimerase
MSETDVLGDPAAGRPDLARPGSLPDREGDPPRLVADVSRLREEVGFAPRIGPAECLKGTVEWVQTSKATR